MDVVCTAGHVDHGKSTLVKALTGMEPDRFAEERRRGLTIDLGFAWADLGRPPRTVAFVDLPGHERFIANMLAGAGAVEVALFVVAADEGWMPQSQEHLEILDLLGISRGVVAVTKTDTVDTATVARAESLVRERLGGTGLKTAEVVRVSAVTGDGLDRLVERLTTILAGAPPARDDGRPRLWIDRSFSIRGAGTVVTGTLTGGTLRVGDEAALLPAGPTSRIRGLQSLKAPVDAAGPGNRVAVNLSGVNRADVARGDALVLPGQWRATSLLDAWVQPLPARDVGRRGAWHLHAGSGRRLAQVRPLGAERLGGQPGHVRIELDRPIALTAGDRFVLREAGRRATIAGGTVLDPDPPSGMGGRASQQRHAGALDQRRAALDAGDRPRLLALHVAERGAAGADRSAAAVGLDGDAAAAAARDHRLLTLGDSWVHPSAAAVWGTAVTEALDQYHQAHPLERAAPKDVAVRGAGGAGCPPHLAAPLVDTLVRVHRIVAEGPGVRLPGHAVQLDPEQGAARDRFLTTLAADPFAPPRLAAAAAQAGAPPELVRELEAAGAIVRLAPDLAMVPSALDQAAERLRAAYAAEGPLTAARAKEVLGTTRKFALPLLEELDRRGITRRRGDVRDVRDVRD
jgi:selenocysteine-specific elongation factor